MVSFFFLFLFCFSKKDGKYVYFKVVWMQIILINSWKFNIFLTSLLSRTAHAYYIPLAFFTAMGFFHPTISPFSFFHFFPVMRIKLIWISPLREDI